MAASLGGHSDVVKALLEKGADVNVRSNDGKTALTYAEQSGNTEIIRLLKEAAAKQKGEAGNNGQ